MMYLNNTSGIYQIRNKISNKIYVGSAANLYMRFAQHKSKLKQNDHPNKHLQNAWNKHGAENFEFKVLELIEDKTKLIEKEQNWIEWFKCVTPHGYNLRSIAHSNFGLLTSNETKLKLSKANIGIVRSKETRAKMSAWQIGRKMSKEAKLNMAQSTRKVDIWPHELGAKCKCQECKSKRTFNHKMWERNAKIKKLEQTGYSVASEYILGMM